jgi:hypothetical protein
MKSSERATGSSLFELGKRQEMRKMGLKMRDVHEPYALGCEDADPFLIGSSVKRPQATPFTKT